MRSMKRHLLVEVAGKEVSLDIPDDNMIGIGHEIATELAKQHNVYTDCGKPLTLTGRIFSLTISKGVIQKTFLKAVDIPVVERSMTETYYKAKMDELLEHLPQAARYFIHKQAWDRGHSYGYDECYNIAQDLVSEVETMLANL